MLLGRYWYALLAFIGSPGKIRALSIGLVRHLKVFKKPYDLLILGPCQEVVNKIQDITSSSVIITTRLLHTQTEVFICDKVAAAAAECINY